MAMAKKQFNLYLDETLIKAVKHAAVENEQRLSDYVADVLKAHLGGTNDAPEFVVGDHTKGNTQK